MGWQSFEPALSRAQEMRIEDIRECAAAIPSTWYSHDANALDNLVEALYRRSRIIPALIAEFRQSNRNPFPNWRKP
jgi:hypothetical protein